ncbi:MAG: hybrid sensor histidine kinase/response regulator [Bacteroidales bacterium]|nr:hybrid sensor histidine kinase/response regulator [Bacteroidales bacterium]
MAKQFNEFEPFLNDCQTYVWEWYIPEHKVRFGIPSLNSLWIDDKEKNIKLDSMLERVHPDDIQKVLIRHTSPLYRSDKMFEVDLRLNVSAQLKPDGQSSGEYEWYGFRGRTVERDRHGRPTYVRGIAINLDQRYRAQLKLINQKEHQLQHARQQLEYSSGIIQEVGVFFRNLAENANVFISSDGISKSEDMLMHLADLKDKVSHLLEMTDKFKFSVGDNELSDSSEVSSLALWEHFAELQQVYSLRAGNRVKFYFSNLYDNVQIFVDVKLLDLLLDNLINPQFRSQMTGTTTMSYVIDLPKDVLYITVTCSGTSTTEAKTHTSYTESGLGLSVCRLMAKRMYGSVQLEQQELGKLKYTITLPLDARKVTNQFSVQLGNTDENVKTVDVLDELKREHETEAEEILQNRALLPHVLIGMRDKSSLYSNQHLFDVTVTSTTDEFKNVFDTIDPDIVFLDSSLPGRMQVFDLITYMHEKTPETPIIITDDYGQRPLHKRIRQLGARYLLNNPLSLRKVNLMIKKYLK